jgi:type I restriction enzyme S subunit
LDTSAGNYNINSRNIQSLPIPVPDEADQEKIVQLARACTELVLTAKQRVSILERIKRGLMQDLLTGKVRVSASLEVAGA